MSLSFKGGAMEAIFQRSLHLLGESGESPKVTCYLRDHVDFWHLSDGEVVFSFDDAEDTEGFLDVLGARHFAKISRYLQLLVENFINSAALLENAEFEALEWDVVIGAELDGPESEGIILGRFSLTATSIQKVPAYPPLNDRAREQIEEILRGTR